MIQLHDHFKFTTPRVTGFSPVAAPSRLPSPLLAKPVSPGDSVHFTSWGRNNSPSPLQRIVNDSLVNEAGNGNLSAVSRMLSSRVDINHANRYHGKTALMMAAENNKTDVLRLLIRKRANLEKVDYTALMLAARTGSIDSMKILLDAGAKINATDQNGMNALLVAVNCQRKAAVDFLLDQNWNIETTDYLGRTPLQLSAERGNLAIVDELIARHANLERGNFEEMNPLLLACREGRLPIVKALVEAGANVNARNRFGTTPLMLAARDGKLEVVKYLLEKQAVVNVVSNDQETALSYAVGSDRVAITRLLMDHGAALNVPNNQGCMPLMEAARLGYGDIVKALLQLPHHVAINHHDPYGLTALSYAADRGARETIIHDLLQVDGIDIEARDTAGNTPLLLAARRGATKSVQVLAEHGADVNARNRRNTSALHLAASQGNARMTKFLVSKDANTNVLDLDGATPIFLAAQASHGQTMDALLKPEGFPPQRPHTISYHQFQNYMNIVARHAGLDRDKPFSAMLPTLAKHDNHRLVDPLFLAQEQKPLSSLSWEAKADMDKLLWSSRAFQHEKDPEMIRAQKEYRDERWKNLEFLARHKVAMEPAVLEMAIAMKERADFRKAVLAKMKAEKELSATMDQVSLEASGAQPEKPAEA